MKDGSRSFVQIESVRDGNSMEGLCGVNGRREAFEAIIKYVRMYVYVTLSLYKFLQHQI